MALLVGAMSNFANQHDSGHQDPELRKWLITIVHDNMAGDFLKLLAMAALHADHENYPILRPALLEISKRYPKYNE